MEIVKKDLEELYNIKKLSVIQIAKRFNVSQGSLMYWFKKYNIKRRTHGEAKRLLVGREFFYPETIKKENWKSLGWVLDTEGSIGFQSYKKGMPSISMGMSSKKFIDNMIKEFPNLFTSHNTKTDRWRNQEWIMYSIRINNMDYISYVLKNTIPFLTSKKYQAILLKNFCDRKSIRRKQENKLIDNKLKDYIRRLNTKKQTDEDRNEIWKEVVNDELLKDSGLVINLDD